MKRIKQLLLSIILLAIFSINNAQSQSCWSVSDSSYTMGFEGTDTAEFYGHWTIDDTNDNDTTWETSHYYTHTGDSCIVIKQYGEDWLFSRCFTLDSNTKYEITFWYRKVYPYIPDQSLRLCVGDTAKQTAMNDTLLDIDSILGGIYNDTSIVYTAPDDTVYVFGWYAYGTSDYEWTRLYIDDITIEEFTCDSIIINLGNDTVLCGGDSVILTVDSTYAFYNWNGEDSLSDTYELEVDTSGTYWVAVTDVNGCIGYDTIVVTVITLPDDSIILTGNDTICYGDSIKLEVSLAGAYCKDYIIQWFGTDSAVTDSVIYVKTSGSYGIIFSDTNYTCLGFSDSLNIVVFEPYDEEEICLVTVDSATGYNKIVWEKTDTVRTELFVIYRENTNSEWDSIGSVPFDSLSIFVDSTSNPKQRAYNYQLTVIDTCDNESEPSTTHTTMHLEINQGVGGVNNLAWNHYEGFDFDTYKIYRDTSAAQNNPQLLDSIQSTFNTYTDLNPIAGFDNYYVIEVIRDSSCISSKKKKGGKYYLSSFSNKAKATTTDLNDFELLSQPIIIYPNPYNEFTAIEYTLAKPASVVIEVYDIWGDEIALIAGETQQAGKHNYQFSAKALGYAAGVYYIKFNINEITRLRKIVEIE